MMERPHAVIIPYPGSGHINPMLKLAKLLHCRGFYITFVNTEFAHQRILRSNPVKCSHRDDFRFQTIPDGLSPNDRGNPRVATILCISMRANSPTPFRELLVKLNRSFDVPPVSCIIPNGLMSFTFGVAESLGIPTLVFWTTSACGFMAYLQLGELIRRGYTPLKDESCLTNGYLDTPIDWIPGMKGIRLRDLASFVRTTDGDDVFLNYDKEEAYNSLKAWGLILNTFEPMETEVLDALKSMFPRMYTIGPLPSLLNQMTTQNQGINSANLSLWEEDFGCMEWLDARGDASVLYVNFGSISVMTIYQLTEFAWGLADCNHPFLWIIRPDSVLGGRATLPEGFVEKTRGRSFIASWCNQEEVLSHSSIGGFLTHCGWNSIMDSVCCGVPMICWPGFAEQYTNCRYTCKEWGIGIEIDGEVTREKVAGLVRELMEGKRGEDMRSNTMEWKERAEEATTLGGSYADFERLVKDLTSKKMDRNTRVGGQ